MPRNGTGTYSLPQAPFVAGSTISSAAVNSDFNDIATALTGSLPRNGEAGMSGQLKLADGGTATPSMTFTNDPNTGFFRPAVDEIGVVIGGAQTGFFAADGYHGVVTSIGIAVGSILDYAGAGAPALWLLCFGQNVSRTTYSALFAVINNTYGNGDGSTTFGLPDLRGSLIYGKDDMGGSASGRLTSAFYGSDPTVLGNRGGSQSKSLLASNLPPYTPSGTVTNGAITISQNAANLGGTLNNNGGGGGSFGVVVGAATITASQAASTFSGVAQGGTTTAFAVASPGIVVNKIIYAGV